MPIQISKDHVIAEPFSRCECVLTSCARKKKPRPMAGAFLPNRKVGHPPQPEQSSRKPPAAPPIAHPGFLPGQRRNRLKKLSRSSTVIDVEKPLFALIREHPRFTSHHYFFPKIGYHTLPKMDDFLERCNIPINEYFGIHALGG